MSKNQARGFTWGGPLFVSILPNDPHSPQCSAPPPTCSPSYPVQQCVVDRCVQVPVEKVVQRHVEVPHTVFYDQPVGPANLVLFSCVERIVQLKSFGSARNCFCLPRPISVPSKHRQPIEVVFGFVVCGLSQGKTIFVKSFSGHSIAALPDCQFLDKLHFLFKRQCDS